jgi:hypothetical protein
VIEILIEVFVDLFGEVLLDVVVHAVGARRGSSAVLRLLFFALMGAVTGALSLLVLPRHFIRSADLRLVALAVTPIVAGALFSWVGRSRRKRDREASALESFWPAFSFALAMAVVRYFAAR